MFAVGWALQHVVLNRTLGNDILPPLLVTFGLSIVLQNGAAGGLLAPTASAFRAGALETASVDRRAGQPSASCRF